MRRLIELIGVGLVAGLAVALALPVVAQDTFITGELILTEDMSSDSAKHLAPGPPEPWQFISGAGTWAGVSPPSDIGVRTSEIEINTGVWVGVLSVTVAPPAITSDVILGGWTPVRAEPNTVCQLRIVRGSTVLLTWSVEQNSYGSGSSQTAPFAWVDIGPGVASHTYGIQGRRSSGSSNCVYSTGGSLSYMVAQVYE